jgi:drug/metabolite transporter (DMT)-like permease
VIGPELAIGSSLSYGGADFLGGTISRRITTLRFIFCAQILGATFAGVWTLIAAEPLPNATAVLAAAGAGLALCAGLGAFFEAMVVGRISIVAPIMGTGVIVPVIAGLIRGERPDALQILGMVVVVIGVAMTARQPGDVKSPEAGRAKGHEAAGPEPRKRAGESGLGLAFLAAIATGMFLWLMAPASRGGVGWAVLIARAIPIVVLTIVLRRRRISIRPALERDVVGSVILAALLSFGGVSLYGLATLHGRLTIVSVLGSLYPAVTVILAHRVLGERVYGMQRVGILATIAGVIALSV